jgi:nucleotidyltransferase substrate binding protein (TIGR01987 family)
MSREGFDAGNLYGLQVCLRDLEDMLVRHHEAKDDKAVRYALIKTFELTYEMAVKTLRKYLMANSERTEEVAEFDFRDLIRLADQAGLLLTGWPEWNDFRKNRGRTVHTYGDQVALQITEQLPRFAEEVRVLLTNLEKRVKQDHG